MKRAITVESQTEFCERIAKDIMREIPNIVIFKKYKITPNQLRSINGHITFGTYGSTSHCTNANCGREYFNFDRGEKVLRRRHRRVCGGRLFKDDLFKWTWRHESPVCTCVHFCSDKCAVAFEILARRLRLRFA